MHSIQSQSMQEHADIIPMPANDIFEEDENDQHHSQTDRELQQQHQADESLTATLTGAVSAEEEDYLNYLDKFQNQLRTLSVAEDTAEEVDQLSDDSLRMR